MYNQATAPPGWEDTVTEMKKIESVTDPHALAWHMKRVGMQPGDDAQAKAGKMQADASADEVAVAAGEGHGWAQSQLLAGDAGYRTFVYREQPW